MKLLDCTLRDGGYYNNWDFPQAVVEAYLHAAADAGINYVELGLRNFPKSGFLGAFAYTTEQHLNTLDLPVGPTYGVMIDAKTILDADMDPVVAIDTLFVPRKESKVGLVRIAAHFHEVEHSASMVARLKELGYIVGYNLMQSCAKPTELIAEKARIATSWGDNLDVLYFADSLGNMNEVEVERIINAIRTEWDGTMGIHTHDNMSKGLDNSLTAKNNGVEWLDATITGMGRGAGNTQMERLLAIIAHEYSYKAQPIYDLVVRHFEKMQKDYGWGTNLLYFLGAQNNVHPTYIQNLLTSKFYGSDEIISAIGYLSKLDNSQVYNGLVLENAINSSNKNYSITGSCDVKGLFKQKEVLLITNGPSTQKYKEPIELYIKEKNPIVISVNINDYINEELIDYYVISHNVKLLTDFDKYKNIQKKLILPKHRFDNDELSELKESSILDYGFEVSEDIFEAYDNYVTSPYDITIAYCLGIVSISNCKSVSLVGFDGFEKNDDRQVQMLDLLNHYNKKTYRPKLTALTPTTYTITQSSIYAIH